MIRNLKVLGLAMVAMLAMTAVAAGSASADPMFHSDAENEETTVTAEETTPHVFNAAGNTITCQEAHFNGFQDSSTAKTLRMTAEYDSCKVKISFFTLDADVLMNGCEYEFSATGTVGVVDKEGESCTEDPISFTVEALGSSCTVTVDTADNNEALESVTYTGTTTSGNGGDIDVDADITGIHGEAHGGLCTEPGTFTDGEYTGSATVSGTEEGGGDTPIWVTHE